MLCLGCAVGGALAYPTLRPGRRGLGGLDVDGGGDCGHGHDAEGCLRTTRGAEVGVNAADTIAQALQPGKGARRGSCAEGWRGGGQPGEGVLCCGARAGRRGRRAGTASKSLRGQLMIYIDEFGREMDASQNPN